MDQLFRMCEILSPAVDALLGDLEGERRAARMRYAQSGVTGGRYGDILRGWQGQAELIRARLVKEILATRLDSSSGQELKDLAKSEYFAELPNDPQKAVGQAELFRSVVNASSATTGNFGTSVIPAGTRIKRTVSKTPRVDQPAAEYVTTVDASCPDIDSGGIYPDTGDSTHFQSFTVPIIATREGPHANFAAYTIDAINPRVGTVDGQIAGLPFAATNIQAAGGTLGVVDEQIRALARALAIGSGGPTALAAVAGALTNSGVRRALYVENPTIAKGKLYLADEDWAYSAPFLEAVFQELRSYPWIGWGCKIELDGVLNAGITVRPTVTLRSREYESATTDITAAIVKALQSYFDDRPDWYTWTLNAIGATVGAADDRILACTAVAVLSEDGTTIIAEVDEAGTITGTEPAVTVDPFANSATHYALIDQGATPIYQYPGA